jgi:hypothetical protein
MEKETLIKPNADRNKGRRIRKWDISAKTS